MPRGRKIKRGGGHTFSRDLVLDEDGVAVSSGADKRWVRRKPGEEGEDDEKSGSESEEEEEEESEEDVPQKAGTAIPSVGDTAANRAAKKAQKQLAKKTAAMKLADNNDDEDEDDDSDLVNPNRAAPKTLKAADLDAPRELSRKEREAKEKKEAQDRYWKLHVAGKTDQAKADMARLAAIRKQREDAAAQRKAEQEAKDAELKAKQAASRQKR